MNIVINKEKNDRLQEMVIETTVVGSHLYGVAGEKSDKDIMCFVEFPMSWNQDILEIYPNYHQFWYKDKETNTDYLYTSYRQFMRNMINGDATINVDVMLFTDLFLDNDMRKLQMCRTYNIVKAFLGFAKRDLKSNTEKKRLHAYRSLYCAGMLLDNEMPLVADIQKIYKPGADEMTKDELIEYESSLRKRLTGELNANTISKYYLPEVKDELFSELLKSNNVKNFTY